MESLKLRGNECFRNSQFEDAAKLYSEVINNIKMMLWRRSVGNLRQNQAIELSPQTSILWSNRCACYLALGLLTEAEADAKQAIYFDNSNVKAYYRLSVALERQGRLEEATLSADVGLTIEPENKPLRDLKNRCTRLNQNLRKDNPSSFSGVWSVAISGTCMTSDVHSHLSFTIPRRKTLSHG